MGLVAIARLTPLDQPLQLHLQFVEHDRIEQLPQLVGSQQVGQQLPIDGKRRGSTLGQRGITLVHVGGDPGEGQGLGERRRGRGVDRDRADPSGSEVGEQPSEGIQVEDVGHALPRGLEQDRERRVLGGDRQEVGGTLALLPQRCALVGSTPGKEQSARRALPETRGEHGRARQLGHDQLVDLLGVDQQLLDRQVVDGFGESQHDPVVAPDHLGLDPPFVGEPGPQRDRPWRMHPRPERGEDADPPIADLVAEPLDHDGAVVGHGTRGLALIGQVLHQVGGGQLVQAVVVDQSPGRPVTDLDLTGEGTDRPAQLHRTTRTLAVPERHLAGLTGRRRHDHPLERDVLDPPGRCAQQEGLPRSRLVHHLLVQLPHPRTVGQEHSEQATVGDRPGVGHRQSLRARPTPDPALDPIPYDAGPEPGELLGRVPARQQIQDRLEHVVGQLGERRRPPHQCGQLVDVPVVERAHGHDLLGQHVQRVPQIAGLLDGTLLHPLGDHRCFQQIGPMFGEEPSPTGFAHLMAGAPHSLETRGDRPRRLDLDDKVDRSHVDPELERRGGDQAAELATLQLVLDDETLLPAERAVVGSHQLAPLGQRRPGAEHVLLAGVDSLGALEVELVESRRQSLGQAPAVDEHDRGAMLEDQVQQPGMHGRPDRAARRPAADGPRHRFLDGLSEAAHVLDGNDDLEVQLLANAGVDDGHGPSPHARIDVIDPLPSPGIVSRWDLGRVPPEESGDLVQGPLGGGETHPLRWRVADRLQPLERERQVRTTLRTGHRMDLVDDHRVDVGQGLPGPRGEHEVERLGCRDEDVGRMAHQRATLVGGGVAGADSDGGLVHVDAEPLAGQPDARQRGAEILLDVDRQRPER